MEILKKKHKGVEIKNHQVK
jgi:DNA topoisomerase II